MSKTKRRLKAQKRRAQVESWAPKSILNTCRNCGEKGPHYVPPSFGDKGFFICSPKVGDSK